MKRYDFHPDPEMSPTIGLLHAAVTHNDLRLRRLVEGLPADEIDYRGPSGEQNSIAQLLRHLTVVDLHWVYRLQGVEVPVELQARFGPMIDENGKLPKVQNVPLQRLLEEYEYIQNLFRETCLNLTDADLSKVVPYENGNDATIRWGIWHVADHNRYHQAHIVQIKNALHER